MVKYLSYLNYCQRQSLAGKSVVSFGEWKQFQINQNNLKKVVDIRS